MRKIGVLDAEMEYDPTAVVCRQDLAVYIAKLLGATEAEVECRYFVDVPEGSYGTWAINYLTERGIFNINSQHLFNPKAETNTDEVYKVLTTALGYGRYAEAKGGYPVGYRMAARTAEISFGDIERLNFQTLMVMIYRASTARLYEPVSIGSESIGMNKTNATLLSVYHNIYEKKGTVSAIGGMATKSNEWLDDGKIKIGENTYLLDTEVYEADFPGRYVKYFYQDNGGKYGLVKAIFPEYAKVDTVIAISDLVKLEPKFVTYISNNKSKTVNFTGMSWLYNGRPLERDLENTFANLNKGSVVLRDSDADDVYDTVLIWDYANFVVNGINENTEVLYNGLESGGSVEKQKFESVMVYDGKKNDLLWEDISVNNVLSVAQSKDKKIVSIIVSNTEFNGVLLNTYNKPLGIGVNGEIYQIEPSYEKEYRKTAVSAGNVYHYKTDVFGYVAYIYSDAAESAMKFGYILEGAKEETAFSESVKLRMLSQDGTVGVFEFAENVRIDGRRCKTANEIIAAFPDKSSTEELISQQMIRYETNADNKIKSIDTTNLNPKYETSENSLCAIGNESFDTKWYRRNRVGIDAYIDNTKTSIFAIPERPLFGGMDAQEYRVGNVGTLMSEDRQIAANVYTASGRSEFAEAMIYKYSYSRLNRNFSPTVVEVILVDEIAQALDEDGEIVKCVKGMRGGSEVTVYIPNNVNLGDIGRGDLVQFRYGINDQIVPSYVSGEPDVVILYDYSLYEGERPTGWRGATTDKTLYEAVSDSGYNYYRAERQLSYGFVSDKTQSYLWWGYIAPTEYDATTEVEKPVYDEMFKVSDVPIMVYDKNAVEGVHMYKGTINDIEDAKTVGKENCSRIILHTGLGTGRALFVYK